MTTTPAPPPRSPTARRHSTATMALARTMYADGEGWTPNEIAAYLLRRGTPVAPNTVRRWVYPDHAQRCDAKRNATRYPAAHPEVESDHDRMLRVGLTLRARGMPYRGVAIALAVCEGIEVDPDALRLTLRAHGAPRDETRVRA